MLSSNIRGNPTNIELDYKQSIHLQYLVNQTINNYSAPTEFNSIYHDIQINISFTDTADWIILSQYDWNYMFFKNLRTNNYKDEFSYRFYNTSKFIYESTPTANYGFDVDSTNSIISTKTDINLGETELIRLDSVVFFGVYPTNNTNMTYSTNREINVMNKNYTTRVFQGNITEFTSCA